jgi:MGT family glycosyltransferase
MKTTLLLPSRRLRFAPVAKIAVVHVPYFSHIDAAMRLSRVLKRQGHELVVWAPEAWREEVESCGALFQLHEPEMPQSNSFMSFVASLARTTDECAGELIEELFAHEVDLVVHDSQVPWARVAGDYLGLPRIVSHPMFPIISPHHTPPEDDQSDREPDDPEQARELFETHWLSIVRRWGVDLGGWDSVIHSTSSSETTVTYTTEEIVGEKTLAPTWHCIGPLLDPLQPGVGKRELPLVYMCLGTSFNTRKSVFAAAIEGLAAEPFDVLISTGNGIVSADDLGPLPSNVEVRDYVSTREALTQASAHITHGGCNSVHESLLAGVPMALVPQAFDQFPLAGRVERLGAGLAVDETPAAIRSAVRWLVRDETMQARTREIGRRLASYDGDSRVAAIVSRVLEEDAAPNGTGAGGEPR